MTWKHSNPKSVGCNTSSFKRKVYSDKSLTQKTRKTSNKQPKLIPKWTRKRRKQHLERNHKDQSRNEWNTDWKKMEKKKKSTEIKSSFFEKIPNSYTVHQDCQKREVLNQ